MKTKYFLYAILMLLVFTCNSSDDDGSNSGSTIYEYYDDAKMVFEMTQGVETLRIEPGTNTVFRYYFQAADDEDIADDEYAESIHFEVNGSLESFSYTDVELRELNLFIKRACFCPSADFVFPETGTVTGTKSSNGNWAISISISFEWDENSQTDSRTINGTFRLKPIP